MDEPFILTPKHLEPFVARGMESIWPDARFAEAAADCLQALIADVAKGLYAVITGAKQWLQFAYEDLVPAIVRFLQCRAASTESLVTVFEAEAELRGCVRAHKTELKALAAKFFDTVLADPPPSGAIDVIMAIWPELFAFVRGVGGCLLGVGPTSPVPPPTQPPSPSVKRCSQAVGDPDFVLGGAGAVE